jgi:hypothetical protein
MRRLGSIRPTETCVLPRFDAEGVPAAQGSSQKVTTVSCVVVTQVWTHEGLPSEVVDSVIIRVHGASAWAFHSHVELYGVDGRLESYSG